MGTADRCGGVDWLASALALPARSGPSWRAVHACGLSDTGLSAPRMPPMRGAGGGKTVLWRTSSTTPAAPCGGAAVLYSVHTTNSSGRDARAVRRLARRHPALGPHLGGVRIPEVGSVQVHRAPFQRRPAVDPRPPTCHPPQSQIVLVHVAFPQHCLTIYNPLQRDNLPRQAGAPRAGLSTSGCLPMCLPTGKLVCTDPAR